MLLLHRLLTPPTHFPRSLPRIPIYVSLLGFLTRLDQTEIYARYLKSPLETHGAAIYFFGARWNILVQRPSFLTQLLRHEDSFAKSGNQKKIPYSVLADFTGDNIISAHGSVWEAYRAVMKSGLQRKSVDVGALARNSDRFVSLLLEEQKRIGAKGGVLVNPVVQRFAMQCLGDEMLGIDFKTLHSPNSKIHLIHTKLKLQIFKPLYLNFPFLDLFPIPSRIRARALVKDFEDELIRQATEQNIDPESPEDDRLISRMLRARNDGTWSEGQFRDNLKITFIAGHENVQQLLNSIIYILARYPVLQTTLRSELLSVDADTLQTSAGLSALPKLTSVIFESLRLFPPIPQLVNRKMSTTTQLGHVIIPRDTYVGWTAFGANRDPVCWGADADAFIPERWGTDIESIQANARKFTARGQFVSFHGGKRACLGQGFAMLEVRVALVALLKRCQWRFVDHTGDSIKFTPGGLLAPVGMRLCFVEL